LAVIAHDTRRLYPIDGTRPASSSSPTAALRRRRLLLLLLLLLILLLLLPALLGERGDDKGLRGEGHGAARGEDDHGEGGEGDDGAVGRPCEGARVGDVDCACHCQPGLSYFLFRC